MNPIPLTIKRALLSVSNKSGIVEFARELKKLHIEILSTGGTSQLLHAANIPVTEVADLIDFPEMMDGRVKTLHPKIHGGILGLRDQHAEIAKQHDIEWIDLVVVNLYPFAETIRNPVATWDDAIENIDIGGPAMIRSAAKNVKWVSVVVDPEDYQKVIAELQTQNRLNFNFRKDLAAKAFAYTAAYDALIHSYLIKNNEEKFPIQMCIPLQKQTELRYGENPHQAASAYRMLASVGGILSAKQYQGKELSYNNIVDADAAAACANQFTEPACVIVKHANPCGVSSGKTGLDAFQNAFNADSASAFGGVISLNCTCTKDLADIISRTFFEVLIAPNYTAEALDIFASKPNLRVLEWDFRSQHAGQEYKFITGGVLIQTNNNQMLQENELNIVTTLQPSVEDISSMLFAWKVVSYSKSNAIVIAKNNTTCGIGAGQVSRIDSVDIAVRKAAKNTIHAVLASDAFFPFRDSIDRLANTGIRAVIQPGGSMRDEEVIAACNEHKISMVFTGIRCFRH